MDVLTFSRLQFAFTIMFHYLLPPLTSGLGVPANYDLELVPALAQYPVTKVYGELPGDLMGGGQPSYRGAPVRETPLAQYT